ncbi:DNA-binding beta-propeller fold protein YncE [Silvibacterium bohemicum]|uniref:DNA-binding beta-propeller fold protein YncE n=1 Tax=Silvibacterium bohemicum TaxID=1577686 RepID=A0A841K175_9BACT|nr:YncE family protein [Silvibacterium bohemicum]MBB6145709.1 DNA-binding beta-propeller fold protein YncE [Silvibacterium bohemicum]
MQNQLCKLLAMAALSTSLSAMAGAQTIKTSIAFPSGAQGVAVNPITNTVYAVAPNNGAATDNLGVINGSTDTLAQTVSVPSGSLFVAVDYLANRVYVAGCNTNLNPSPCTVTVIDGKSNKTLSTIPVTTTPGFGLTGIVANPLDGKVYVANGSDNVINIINGSTAKLRDSIDLHGNQPVAIAINPILNRLYVPFGSDLTAVIEAGAKKIIANTVFGSSTMGAAANFVTGNVFVTDQEPSGLSMTGVLSHKGALLASPTVGDAPLGVDVDPVTNLAFVAATAQDAVDVISGANNTVTATIQGVPANYVALNFATAKVYVTGRTGVTVLTEK